MTDVARMIPDDVGRIRELRRAALAEWTASNATRKTPLEKASVLLERGLVGEAEKVLRHSLVSLDLRDIISSGDQDLGWMLVRLHWEQGRWTYLRDIAISLVTEIQDRCFCEVEARAVIRGAVAATNLGDPAKELFDAVRSIEERVRADRGPLTVLADIAHFRAFEINLRALDLDTSSFLSSLAVSLYTYLGDCTHASRAYIVGAKALLVKGRVAEAA